MFGKKEQKKKPEEKPVNICPVCGKPYDYALTVSIVNGKQVCKHDEPSPRGKIAKRRHANEEASAVALRMAAEARATNSVEGNVMVPVKSYQTGKDRGQTEMIPKKVIESIEEKVAPLLDE